MRRAALIGLVVVLAAPAAAQARKKPDLVVRSGKVALVQGRLTGTVKVRNAGRARARRSTLAVAVGGVRAGTVTTPALRRGRGRVLTVDLAPGKATGAIRACADARHRVRERREKNNCRSVGSVSATPAPGPAPTPTATPEPTSTAGPVPASSVPSDPIAYTPEQVIDPGAGRTYWTYVPKAYDSSNQTPIRLLVWLHGCFGNSSGDIYTVSPGGDQNYIAITVDGREYKEGVNDGCWKPGEDQDKVLAAIANVKTHFNVDPHRVVIGGYSSGGDLAYRTAFYHANAFAGLLAENTSPFRDTGSSAAQSLAAAAWKFNVVHLAHNQDDTYDIDGVSAEVKQVKDAGFPVTFITRDGGHGDDTTDADLKALLLPHMADDWRSP